MIIHSDCGALAVQNGTVQYLQDTTYGQLAIVQCDDGYILQGSDHVTCELGGTWSAEPQCVRGKQ